MISELIVKMRAHPSWQADAAVREGRAGAPAASEGAFGLHDLLVANGLSARPLRQQVVSAPMMTWVEDADLSPRHRLDAYWSIPADTAAQEGLRAQLERLPETEAAFIVPAPEVMRVVVPAAAAQAITPDFRTDQKYLDPAPGGVDAKFAWTQPGGRGFGVNVIDIEGDWLLDHEKLVGRISDALSLFADPAATWGGQHDAFIDHGTSVLGEMLAADDGIGVGGIAPEATFGVVSHMHREQTGQPSGPATAIANATDLLHPGDVLLLEMHMPGPRFGFSPRVDQLGYIAVEWWEHIFDAIKDATDRGIIVIEAGGNGRENLDDGLYNKSVGFSSTWRNPFGRTTDPAHDSGAIVVGAGASPNDASAVDRSRLDFSNFGSTLDAQAWGRGVVTTGGGDLQGGQRTRWYTSRFGGTSSAFADRRRCRRLRPGRTQGERPACAHAYSSARAFAAHRLPAAPP